MICPKCLVQMHQFEKMGGGESNDYLYKTWEVKECPVCLRKVMEVYSATVMSDALLKHVAEYHGSPQHYPQQDFDEEMLTDIAETEEILKADAEQAEADEEYSERMDR
jgi:hypothetical protein